MEQTFGRLPELLLFGLLAGGANLVGGLLLIKAGLIGWESASLST